MAKRITILFLFCFAISVLFAQDSTKLFFAKKFESAAFVEFGSRVIQTNNSSGMDVSISANWLVNHKYYVGAAYSQLASVEKLSSQKKIDILPINYETKLNYQSLGLRIGYILFEEAKIISFSPDLTIGWQGVKLQVEEEETKFNGMYLAPALKSVFNVSSYFRIGLELNYNVSIFKEYSSENNEEKLYNTQLSSKNLSGIGGGIFLRIGKF